MKTRFKHYSSLSISFLFIFWQMAYHWVWSPLIQLIGSQQVPWIYLSIFSFSHCPKLGCLDIFLSLVFMCVISSCLSDTHFNHETSRLWHLFLSKYLTAEFLKNNHTRFKHRKIVLSWGWRWSFDQTWIFFLSHVLRQHLLIVILNVLIILQILC